MSKKYKCDVCGAIHDKFYHFETLIIDGIEKKVCSICKIKIEINNVEIW